MMLLIFARARACAESCCLPPSRARHILRTNQMFSSGRACSIVQTTAAPALPDAREH